MENTRQNLELAHVLAKHGEEFLAKHKLCSEQVKAFNAILTCRTSGLGGHVSRCNACGHTQQAYNSCRNRHCPKCQFVKQVQWVDKIKAALPPVKYFHLVFTIPQCLHKTFYINQAVAYSLMFKAAGEALRICAANPKFLGAQSGAVAVLHTWGQALTYHPHIHMIVPAGGLSQDGVEWVPSGEKFFLPVRVLSGLFRGVLSRLIGQNVAKKNIKLPDDVENFEQLKKMIYAKKWVVYAKKPFAGPERVVQYLGRYTHRVAISNSRLIADKDGKISFNYKDYRTGGVNRKMSLDALEFIGRFFRHILPCGFYKIRYFGIMAQCNTKTKLAQCFELIGNEAFLPVIEGLPAIDVWRAITGKDPLICPHCKKGRMKPVGQFPKIRMSPG